MNNNFKYQWDDLDFDLNKAYWAHVGIEKAYKIRVENLKKVISVFKKININVWLYGRTLKYITKSNELDLLDHDDDLGIDKTIFLKNEKEIIQELVSLGFTVIRKTNELVSFCKDHRYIDLCLFSRSNGDYGYGSKWHSNELFKEYQIYSCILGEVLIPKKFDEILGDLYPVVAKAKGKKITKKKMKKLFSLTWYFKKAKFFWEGYWNSKPRDTEVKELSLEDFLNLQVEPDGSFNWRLRKPHLDIVTNNGNCRTVKEILNYLRSLDIDEFRENVIDTDTSEIFPAPIHLSRKFWQTGNNYFANCVLFQFRKNVVPYINANEYISNSEKAENLYSKEYFKNLEIMSDQEIVAFLNNNPIEITKGCCRGGKHRVFSMVGRLLSGKEYIPFKYMEV